LGRQKGILLGIPYGNIEFVREFWKNIVNDVRVSLNEYDNVYSTFDAKSIITKSLILPKVSYIATVLEIPRNIRKSLEYESTTFINILGKVT
jgi:hypothetical protein